MDKFREISNGIVEGGLMMEINKVLKNRLHGIDQMDQSAEKIYMAVISDAMEHVCIKLTNQPA